MALPLKKTLGELRAELQTRTGFGASGTAGIVNAPIMNSFLRSAQEQLYEACDWRELVTSNEILTGVSQSLYDYPADCNIERIRQMSIWDGGRWCDLVEDITSEQRSYEIGGRPMKYERMAQIELWPVPQAQYRFRREYVKTLAPFTESLHRASLPTEPIFLVALANAKAHYKQADADRYQTQAEAVFTRLKAQHRGRTVWERETPTRHSRDAYYSFPPYGGGGSAPAPSPTPAPPAPPPPAGGPSLRFNLASNSQYLALVSVGGM